MSNQHSSEAHIILYLGKTLELHFPLILILGREYNSRSINNAKGDVINKVDKYDFHKSPKSTFWNRAYGFVGRCYGEAIKSHCRNKEASPIIFSNLLPHAIENVIPPPKKNRLRMQIPEQSISSHVENMFNQHIINRVRIAVLSGIENESIYGRATSKIITKCKERKIPYFEMPYLGNRLSNEQIDRNVSQADKVRIRNIVKSFYEVS